MKARHLIATATLIVAALTAGCGTVNTRVVSTPPGARVYNNGRYMGTTPLTLPLTDNFGGMDEYYILLEKNGFKPQSIEVMEHFHNGWTTRWIPPTLEFNLTPEDKSE